MNELTLDGKIYVSSKRAAEITGYAKDYVGQLCREGRVEARLVGRNWYILKSAIEKHRFVADEPKIAETPELIKEPAVADSWDKPRYEAVEVADLPAIHEDEPTLEEESSSEESLPSTTVEAMQDAWRGWFEKKEAEDGESQEVEIAPEAQNEPESVETDVPLKTIAEQRSQPEVLNLRRIREYQVRDSFGEEVVEKAAVVSEIIIPKGSRGYYRTLQALFIVIAIVAIGVGYVGAGFAAVNVISDSPVHSLAGVSVYNKAI